MARGLPTLFATRSGRVLGKKVAKQLSIIMKARNHEIAESRPNARLERERERIEEIREFNIEHFGDELFHLRYIEITPFSDGEIHVVAPDYKLREDGKDISNSVRGQDVFLIHSPLEPLKTIDELVAGLGDMVPIGAVKSLLAGVRKERDINVNLLEGWITAYTLSKFAESVTLVCPYHPYARQDHSREREASIAKMVAIFTEAAGVKHGFYLDLHSDQIPEFYSLVPDNLRASRILIERFKKEIKYDALSPEDVRMLAPDPGAVGRCRWYATRLDTELAFVYKKRDYSTHDRVESIKIIGDIRDKVVGAIDDLISTGSTMGKLVDAAVSERARETWLACTHPVLSEPAVGLFDNLYEERKIKGVIVMDSITRDVSFSKDHKWYKEVSGAPMLANAIYQLTMEGSVSNVYEGTGKIPVVSFD